MSIIARALLAGAFMSLAATIPLEAQDGSSRGGLGLSIGLGVGSAGVTCEGCDDIDDRLDGISGYLRIGNYVSDQMFLGVEGTGWMKNSEGFERRIAALSLVVLAYPVQRSGLFLRGGFGGIRAVVEYENLVVSGTGLTWQAGVGYDIGVGAIAFTPYVTYVESLEVGANLNDESLGFNLNPNILQVGLALTVR